MIRLNRYHEAEALQNNFSNWPYLSLTRVFTSSSQYLLGLKDLSLHFVILDHVASWLHVLFSSSFGAVFNREILQLS